MMPHIFLTRYFRVIWPLTQVLLLASVVAAWNIPPVRFPASSCCCSRFCRYCAGSSRACS